MTRSCTAIFVTSKALIGTGVALFAMGLIGCQTTQEQTGRHASARNSPLAPLEESIRSYGMLPVLPPSEDLQVGDVYAFPVDPDSDSNPLSDPMEVVASSRWSSLPALDEVDKEYRARPFWPLTPDEHLQTSTDADRRNWAEPSVESGTSVFTGDVIPTRLRISHFNILPLVTLSEGDANELVPSVATNLTDNTEWHDRKVVMAQLGYGESYALSIQKIIKLLVDLAPALEREPSPEPASATEKKAAPGVRYVLKDSHRKYLDLLGDNDSDQVWLRVVTEVLYLRSMDISIQSQGKGSNEEDHVFSSEFIPAEIAGLDEADESEDDVSEKGEQGSDDGLEDDGSEEGEQRSEGLRDADVTAYPEDSSPAEETSGKQPAADRGEHEEYLDDILKIVEDHPLDPAYAAFARADAINRILIESGIDDLPGSVFRFISITEDSVALRRIWSRGAAVGIRGLTLKVNKTTGEILSIRMLGVSK